MNKPAAEIALPVEFVRDLVQSQGSTGVRRIEASASDFANASGSVENGQLRIGVDRGSSARSSYAGFDQASLPNEMALEAVGQTLTRIRGR